MDFGLWIETDPAASVFKSQLEGAEVQANYDRILAEAQAAYKAATGLDPVTAPTTTTTTQEPETWWSDPTLQRMVTYDGQQYWPIGDDAALAEMQGSYLGSYTQYAIKTPDGWVLPMDIALGPMTQTIQAKATESGNFLEQYGWAIPLLLAGGASAGLLGGTEAGTLAGVTDAATSTAIAPEIATSTSLTDFLATEGAATAIDPAVTETLAGFTETGAGLGSAADLTASGATSPVTGTSAGIFGTTAPIDTSAFSTAGTFTTPYATEAGLTTDGVTGAEGMIQTGIDAFGNPIYTGSTETDSLSSLLQMPTPSIPSSPETIAAQQAAEGTAQTTYDAAAQGGVPGYDPTLTSGVATGATAGSTLAGTAGTAATTAATQTAISKILDGTADLADYLKVFGSVAPSVLGAFGADAQTNALKDVFNQFNAQGAPSRARFEGSFAPGFSIWDDPATRDAAARAADISARSYSSRMGNPFDNPTAQAGIYGDVLRGVALPQLNTYRSQNLTGGGQGSNIAGTAAIGGAQAGGGIYDAAGYGLSSLLNPQQNYTNDYLKAMTDYYRNRIPV